jgi:D-inositol-3-phosphate glycosyltransferase
MKKIIIIGPAHPLRGGLATFDERLAREFQAQGHQVRIYTFSLQYPDVLFPGKTQYSDEPAPQDLDIQVLINAINPLNWLINGRKIANENADVVICRFWLPVMSPCLGTILRMVKRNKVLQIIGLIDNIIPHEKRFGDRFLAQYFVNACHRFVVMSQSVAEEMKTFTDKKSTYIPHPIYDNYGDKVSREEGLKQLQLADNQSYILFFGFIRKYKGLDLLIEAMNTEGVRQTGVKLIVAGEFYADENQYRDLIKSYSLDNQIIIHSDFISNDKVRYYFAAADMVVQPYRSATQSGISQIAYHFEKPMLVTNVGGLPEIVAHGISGYVVDTNVQAISEAIVDFYKNKKLAQYTGGVISEKSKFSWDAMANVFLT